MGTVKESAKNQPASPANPIEAEKLLARAQKFVKQAANPIDQARRLEMNEPQPELVGRLLAMLELLRQFAIEHVGYTDALRTLTKTAYASGGSQGAETIQSVMGSDRVRGVLAGRLRAAGFVGELDTTHVSPMSRDVVDAFIAKIEQSVQAYSTGERRKEE